MAKIYSKRIKQNVCNLRSKGWSLGEISLKMRIPKNTISVWVKKIKLTERQQKRIRQKIVESAAIGRLLATKLLREKMEKWKEGIREKVKHFARFPAQNSEMGKLICGLLYLCEGAKYPSSRYLYFGNSDPKIIYTPRPKTAPFRARMNCGRLSIPPIGTPGFSPGGLHFFYYFIKKIL